jgi:signal transduction histidine kinase
MSDPERVGNVLKLVAPRAAGEMERRMIEEDRVRLQAKLSQSHKMESIGRLAGGVAHDFNNMLGVIIGNAELALADSTNSGAHSVELQEILKAAERSANLTRQLLAYARKQTVTPKVVDLNAAIAGMLTMLRRLIGEDIELVWEPKAGPASVLIDPSQIDQILANLAINARDAMDGEGRLTIAVRKVEGIPSLRAQSARAQSHQ